MIIKQTIKDNIDLIEINGPLVLATAEEARESIQRIIDTGTGRMIMNLSGVDPVDSSGLSVVVAALKWIEAKGGDLVLASLSPKAQAIFKLMRLNEVFRIFHDQEAALGAMVVSADANAR